MDITVVCDGLGNISFNHSLAPETCIGEWIT